MDFLIGIIFGTRIFASLTGLFDTDKSQVWFEPPRIVVASKTVRMDLSLRDFCPSDMRTLSQSGTPIVIYLYTEIRSASRGDALAPTVVEQKLTYDIPGKIYAVRKSGSEVDLIFTDSDSALKELGRFSSIVLCPTDSLLESADYVISAYAVLGKIKAEALNNREIDLMYFWNYKRPYIKTDPLAGALLKGKSR